MPTNKVIARFQNGDLLRGSTDDFLPTKEEFRMLVEGPNWSMPILVRLDELKALFFVRDFIGDPQRRESMEFPPGQRVSGTRLRVVFKDGEVMVGATEGYDRTRPGFFLVPADPYSNNESVFVVVAATSEVTVLE